MAKPITPLAQETRTVIGTVEAAHHLNRQPQTLYLWACGVRKGPLEPIRINGRLAWRVSEIKCVLGMEG